MPKINDEKRELNRRNILNIATELFYENGYCNTSVNDIIRSANMSKGRFYTYYESKEDLFFEIIHASDAEIRDQECTFDELGKYIEYRLRRYFNEKNRIRAKYTLEYWSSTVLSGKQQSILDTRYNDFQKDIIKIIEKGQNQGIYSKNIPVHTFSHIFMSSIDGIITMDTVLNQPITDEIIKTTIKIFKGYLKGEE